MTVVLLAQLSILKLLEAPKFSVPANIAFVPAMSVPSGFTEDGLPFGLHITAPHFREDILFTIGKDFEKRV